MTLIHARALLSTEKISYSLSSASLDLKVPILAGKRGSRSGRKKVSNVRSFITLLSGEGVISFTKGNNANFSSEKW